MSTTMEDYEEYITQFEEVFKEAKASLEKGRGLVGTERSKTLNEAKVKNTHARSFIESMKQTARSLGKWKELIEEINKNEQVLQALNDDIDNAIQDSSIVNEKKLSYDKEEKRKSKRKAELDKEMDQTKKTMSKIDDNITEIHKIAVETEKIGDTVIEGLEYQGGVMNTAFMRLEDLHDKITVARTELRKIWQNRTTGQMVRGVIILVLIAACFSVIFVKWIYISGSSTTTTTPTPSGNKTVT